ncbi:MAG: c-type cytochrome [Gemmataceae bacterium]|nr:c-type cytochrome [Gemmataceae bacterium]
MLRIRLLRFSLVAVLAFLTSSSAFAQPGLELKRGDHICLIGNTLADRMQHDGWLETLLQQRFPKHELVIRNLGYAADEIALRPREQNFGSPDKHLTFSKADVIFAFFGYNESFGGEAGLADFRKQLEDFLDHTAKQKYNGNSAPRVVLFSPIAHEDLRSPNLPDGRENNARLEMYTKAIAEVAAARKVPFVDLFHSTQALYGKAKTPITLNGIHPTDDGNREIAEIIDGALFGKAIGRDKVQLEKLREVVLDKSLHWFNHYRVTDGYNVYGGRSGTGNYDGQTNATISKRELEIFAVKTANRDRRIWAIAQGSDLKIDDSNAPPPLEIKTNKPGKNPDGSHHYLGGEEAIKMMTVHKGMKVNLFASEEKFPRLANPVQSSVDADGNLWVAVWPSYPRWHPNEELKDAILTFYDDDGDGKADRCVVFADKVHCPTGFEFFGGGIIVCSGPDLFFMKDTDGDGIADVRIRILSGIDTADTHHTANSFVSGPDGALYFQSGIFQVFGIESPSSKPFRHSGTGVYRFDPITHKTTFHFPIGPNPHGDVFDRWGNQFVTDGTGGSGKHVAFPPRNTPSPLFSKTVRPVPAIDIIAGSHFPPELRGNMLVGNVIGFQGVAQYKFVEKDAGFFTTPIEPILSSKDPNFRPSSIRIGGDGALYVTDWQNPLIGHLQHNLRDPNRGHTHGRIYRVTVGGQPLRKPVKMRGKSAEEIVKHLASSDDDIRYRARLELTRFIGHPYQPVAWPDSPEKPATDAAAKFAATLDPANPAHAQPLVEALWVHSMLHVVNEDLLRRVLLSPEGNARAAATRVLREWHGKVKNVGPLLVKLAADSHPRVRAEALIAATSYNGPDAPEVVFAAATLPTDAHLEFVLKEAAKSLKVDNYLADAKKTGKRLSPAALNYSYRNTSIDKLLASGADEGAYRAVLARSNVNVEQVEKAIKGLAGLKKAMPLALAFDLSDEFDAGADAFSLVTLTKYLANQTSADLRALAPRWRKLATQGKTAEARRLGFAAWMTADNSADDVFSFAGTNDARLRDVLTAALFVESATVKGTLYPHVSTLLGRGNDAIVEASLAIIPRIPGHETEIIRDLSALIKAGRQRTAAIGVIKNIPEKHWQKGDVRSLVDHLVAHVSELPAKDRTQPAVQEAIGLARKLAKLLPAPQAAEIEQRLANADVRVIAIGTVPERMIYDKDKIVVQAGRPVELRFSNTDFMPHNLAIIKPGTLEEIGMLSETTAQAPDAAKRQFIPDSPHVLLASRLLQPGETQALPFEAPKTPGVYPIVCTYPGHWRRMYAVLYVVDDLKAYQADPASYLAKANLPVKDALLKVSTQGREWAFDELAPDLKKLSGRSFEVGKSAFKVANCVACHKLNGEGNEFGPDLAKLDLKLNSADVLIDILEPSKRINEKFQSTTFILTTGRTVTGLVVGESPDSYLVVDNPLAKGKPLPVRKSEIDEQAKSKISLMPKGLLDKLSREEILDLVAYLVARGDRQNPIFSNAHHGHHGDKKE